MYKQNTPLVSLYLTCFLQIIFITLLDISLPCAICYSLIMPPPSPPPSAQFTSNSLTAISRTALGQQQAKEKAT